MTPAQIDRLSALLRRHFQFSMDAEISVELDPRQLTKAHVEAFQALGMNRASLGIQDCNPDVQQAIHRLQPAAKNAQAIAWLRQVGVASLNIDLIYGLP